MCGAGISSSGPCSWNKWNQRSVHCWNQHQKSVRCWNQLNQWSVHCWNQWNKCSVLPKKVEPVECALLELVEAV